MSQTEQLQFILKHLPWWAGDWAMGVALLMLVLAAIYCVFIDRIL